MRVIDKIKRNRFWKSVVTLSAGQIVAQLINAMSIPIVSRMYGQAAFGDYGIVTSTAIVIMGFIGLGLGSAIMSAETKKESEKVFRTTFIIQLLLSAFLCLIAILIGPYFELFRTKLSYSISILLMFLYLNLSVHASLMNVYINRLGEDKVLRLNPILGAACTLCITLPLGYFGMDSIGLFAAHLVSLALMNVHMLRYHSPYSEPFRFADIRIVIMKFKHFVMFQYPSNLIGTFASQMPTQMISRFFGSGSLGNYAMTNRVFGVPLSTIAAPIQTVYFRTIAEKHRGGEDIADITYSLISKVMMVAALPLVIGMVFSEEIFIFVLGPQWRIAGQIASLMAIPLLFNFCYSCVTYCRVVIGWQHVNLIVTAVQVVASVGSLLIGALYFKSFIATIVCFAVAETLFNVFNLYMNFFCLKKHKGRFLRFTFIYLIIVLALAVLLNSIL